MKKKLARMLRTTASRIGDLADSLDPIPTLEMIRPGMSPDVRAGIAGAILGAVGATSRQYSEAEAKAIVDGCERGMALRLMEQAVFEKAHEYAMAADRRRYPLSEPPEMVESLDSVRERLSRAMDEMAEDLEIKLKNPDEAYPIPVTLDSKTILEKAPEIASALAKHLSENAKKL